MPKIMALVILLLIVSRLSAFSYTGYQDAIQKVSNAAEAQIVCENRAVYKLDSEQFGERDYWQSIKRFWDTRAGDCEDGAFAIAAMLHDNGYPIVFLHIYLESDQHMVFIYKRNNGYGSAGLTLEDLRLAVYPSIDSLARSLSVKSRMKVIGYRLMWLYPTPENIQKFITSGDNLKKEPIWIRGPYHKLQK